jgi:HSP20 family protein
MEQLVQDAWRTPALPPPHLNADMYETVDGDAYVLEIPVPGLSPDEISIEATPDIVTVYTTPVEQNGQSNRHYLWQEQPRGPMSRIFEFPVEVEPDNITANLEAGMLKIRVPKAAASRRRVIKLQQSDSPPR